MRRKRTHEIDPDEIFLDAKNLPAFDTNQMEGRIERPLPGIAPIVVGLVALLGLAAFAGKLIDLQIMQGASLALQSETNRLGRTPLIAPRGIIQDRNGVQLAWNIPGDDFPLRAYADSPALAHTIGYVSYPKKDQKGFFYQESFEGKDGVERFYDATLRGEPGSLIREVNARGVRLSENIIEPPRAGNPLTLTLDVRVTEKLYEAIRTHGKERGFTGGAGVILDVETGEILALTSFPSFDPEIIASGTDNETIMQYVKDKGRPFLNRATSGLYAPGSTLKPYVAISALVEGVIDANTRIYNSGEIKIENPYQPGIFSVFKDRREFGWLTLVDALAVSSNIFFYEVSGGFETQKGVGITALNKYFGMFGIGKKTGIDLPGEIDGVIPNPEWKAKYFKGDQWRVGDTYYTAIGQYGVQVTPLQLARAVAMIANDGVQIVPHVVDGIASSRQRVDISAEDFALVRRGMRKVVTEGTGQALKISSVSVGAKTGTAEVGVAKTRVNSWSTGFFPYENPRYAFAVVIESGPRENREGVSIAMREVLEWMATMTPEYIKPASRAN